jgi:response regulator RpfG family c-di-GMP phosphodiesterase
MREELLATIQNAVHRYELICSNAALQTATQAMNEQLSALNRALEAKVARVAQQNQQLETMNRALEQNLQRSVELCLKTMQTFYPTLGSQARRVHAICKAMAGALPLAPEQQQVLEISAWLHDIGLLGVPRNLIRRWQDQTQKLTDAERDLIEQHPAMGQELARFIHHLEAVGTTIRAHHERFDGTGYPDALKGEQIPWLGRLLAVAVGYSESNYEGRDAVLDVEVKRGAAYDPEAVRVLLRCLPHAVLPQKEREILLAELRPGMVLARGIYNANGLLLIPEGQELNETAIGKIQAHNRVSPINQSLQVYG